MAKRTNVQIYEVDDEGRTGAQVGEGALVAPRGVLVHPPLSRVIAEGRSSPRLQVRLLSNTRKGPVEKIIDVGGAPLVMGDEESGGLLVAWELGTKARSPIDRMTGLSSVRTSDEFVAFTVPRLDTHEPHEWNGSPLRHFPPSSKTWREWLRGIPLIYRNPVCRYLRRLC